MKFIADECCDTGIVASLRREGHDVFYVLEEEPGLRDEVIRQSKWPRLKKLIDKYADRLPGHFVVIDIEKFRFRPLLFETPSC